MQAIFNSNPIMSRDGQPVHGRFYVYQKDTNQLADIYLYDENNELVKGSNPVYTDNYGYPEYKVIIDEQIYSVVVEQYNGNFTDPKTDEDPLMWEIVNDYYVGSVKDEDESKETVYGVYSLRNADPKLENVTVIGYYTSYDCGPRTYVWDSICIDDPDNGYIIKSDKNTVGRWILVNDLPWIPSEYYGVYPGRTTNLNNLTSVPEQVGDEKRQNVPSCIKFATGTYDLPNDIELAYYRNMLVDNNTSFKNHTVTCNGVTRLGERTDGGIGKLILPETSEARLSWFDDYDSFFSCGSKNLHIDCELSSWVMYEDITLTGATIYFDGYPALIIPRGQGQLTLDNCVIVGSKYGKMGFSDTVLFKNMEFTDNYLGETSSNFNFGSGVTVKCNDFADTANFVKAATELNVSDINLDGRTLDILNVRNTTMKVRNGYVRQIVLNATTNLDLTLDHITSDLVSIGVNTGELKLKGNNSNVKIKSNGNVMYGITFTNSTVEFLDNNNTNGYCQLFHCSVRGNIIATGALYLRNCDIVGDISYPPEVGLTGNYFPYFENCQIFGKTECKNITAYGCKFQQDVWPRGFERANHNVFFNFKNCTFGGGKGIVLKPNGNESQVTVSMVVCNCSFQTQETSTGYKDGIEIQVRSNDPSGDRYINDDPSVHSMIWEGNTGTVIQPEFEGWVNWDFSNREYPRIRFLQLGIVSPYSEWDCPIFVAEFGYPHQNTGTMNILNANSSLQRNTDPSIAQDNINDYFQFVIQGDNFYPRACNNGGPLKITRINL